MYPAVEPLIRHFLFVIGYGEFLPLVVDEAGALQVRYLDDLLASIGLRIDLSKPLNLDDWKILILAWVRKFQIMQIEEINIWSDKLTQMQLEQQAKFEAALEAFKLSYVDQIDTYHRVISEDAREEHRLKQKWIAEKAIREKFQNKQMNYIEQMNRQTAKNFINRKLITQCDDYVKQITDEVKQIKQVPMDSANRVVTYMYMSNLAPNFLPVSGGSPLPRPKHWQNIVQK